MLHSLYTHDFIRIASCVPRTHVADAPASLNETIRLAQQGDALKAALMIFPELRYAAGVQQDRESPARAAMTAGRANPADVQAPPRQ